MAFRSKQLGWLWRQSVAAVLVMTLAACGAAAEPVLPTVRPTYTPTSEASPTPTRTAIPSATPTPAQTAVSEAGGPSPTPLVGEMPTRPRYTLTPTTQPILPGTLQIEYFTTNATAIKPGDSLTLFWSVKGVDKAIIYRLDAKGKREQLWNVARAGSLEVGTRPTDRDVVQFLLFIGDDTTHIEQSFAVPLKCGDAWFFEPQPDGCPSASPVASAEAEQTFEHGLMIWVQAQSRIYVLFNDGQKPAWADFPDEFKDGQPESDPAFAPPQGLIQPIRGFGLVWRAQERVRKRLGWATAAELPFSGMLQGDATVENGVMYIRAKDGNIVELSNKGANWKLITP